jgi:hypothetical protein
MRFDLLSDGTNNEAEAIVAAAKMIDHHRTKADWRRRLTGNWNTKVQISTDKTVLPSLFHKKCQAEDGKEW